MYPNYWTLWLILGQSHGSSCAKLRSELCTTILRLATQSRLHSMKCPKHGVMTSPWIWQDCLVMGHRFISIHMNPSNNVWMRTQTIMQIVRIRTLCITALYIFLTTECTHFLGLYPTEKVNLLHIGNLLANVKCIEWNNKPPSSLVHTAPHVR